MSPEIMFQQPYDSKIDIWALGIFLYELIHGFAPFNG
jgi:serine/threonine protein kinase